MFWKPASMLCGAESVESEMQFNFNLDEVLQIAVRIEQNGFVFYETAAAVLPEHKEWLLFLANEEKKHEAFYEKLRDLYTGANAMTDSMMGDQSEMLEGYLTSMADSVVFRLAEDPRERFTGSETVEQILDEAVNREKDAVLFFTGIKTSMDDEDTQKEIDVVIREEMSHLAMLQRKKLEIAQEATAQAGTKTFELLIIGAGPGGVAAAAEAVAHGVDRREVLVLEAASRNGWSLRRLYPEQRIVTANYQGYVGECRGVMKFRNMLKESAVKMLSETIGDFGIHVLYDCPVKSVRREQGVFVVETATETFRAKSCIAAVGVYGKPQEPDYEIPVELRRKTAFDIATTSISGNRVLVVGGSDSAAIYAEHLIAADNNVTISCREEDLSAMSEDARQKVRDAAEAGDVTLLAGTDIVGLLSEGDAVKVAFKGSTPPQVFDRVVYALGGTSPLASVEMPEVAFDGGAPMLSEHYESSLEGLYFVGDVAASDGHGAIIFALNTAEHAVRRLIETGRVKAS